LSGPSDKALARRVLAFHRRVSLAAVLVTFALYGLAAWMAYAGAPYPGLALGTAAFLAFRLWRRFSWPLTRARFARRPDTRALIERIEGSAAGKGVEAELMRLADE
jgi:hypothetical protein